MTHRDLALDFFRGLALIVIMINHMPMNPLFFYTPSRFGFSDAAEILVFCSGISAAYAFDRYFLRAGYWRTTVKILQRCCKLYAVHIGMFLVLAAMAARLNPHIPDWDLLSDYSLAYFFKETFDALEELILLRYVPNYFDILPLYIAMLVLLPVMISVARLAGKPAALCLSAGIYITASTFGWELLADRLQNRPWYFNPFCWQLLFMIGYALGAKWIRLELPGRRQLTLSAIFIVLVIPLSYEPVRWHIPYFQQVDALLYPWLDKSHLGPLRLVYFLILASLVCQLWRRYARQLPTTLSQPIIMMGQQSLPTFVAGLFCSFAGGILIYQSNHHPGVVALANIGGFAILCLVARIAQWINLPTRLVDVTGSLRAGGNPALTAA